MVDILTDIRDAAIAAATAFNASGRPIEEQRAALREAHGAWRDARAAAGDNWMTADQAQEWGIFQSAFVGALKGR